MMILTYSTMLILVVIFVVSIAWPAGGRPEAGQGGVWVLGADTGYDGHYPLIHSGCDTTNVAALTEDRLHVDYFTTVEQIRMIRFPLPLPALTLAIRMLSQQSQDEVLVVVHKGHMTINRFGNFTTFSIPAPDPASLVMIRDLACITMETSPKLLCVNVIQGNMKFCPDLKGVGYKSYSNIITDTVSPDTVFLVSHDDQVISEYSVSEDCLVFVKQGSPGALGEGLWVSHDNSRLFLGNGGTVSTKDLSSQATLGNTSIGQYTYLSISQLYSREMGLPEQWPLAALRGDDLNTVFHYTWPGLVSNGTEAVPVPEGYKIQRPISLQYCQPDFLYGLVDYVRVNDGALRTGVAYVRFYAH